MRIKTTKIEILSNKNLEIETKKDFYKNLKKTKLKKESNRKY